MSTIRPAVTSFKGPTTEPDSSQKKLIPLEVIISKVQKAIFFIYNFVLFNTKANFCKSVQFKKDETVSPAATVAIEKFAAISPKTVSKEVAPEPVITNETPKEVISEPSEYEKCEAELAAAELVYKYRFGLRGEYVDYEEKEKIENAHSFDEFIAAIKNNFKVEISPLISSYLKTYPDWNPPVSDSVETYYDDVNCRARENHRREIYNKVKLNNKVIDLKFKLNRLKINDPAPKKIQRERFELEKDTLEIMLQYGLKSRPDNYGRVFTYIPHESKKFTKAQINKFLDKIDEEHVQKTNKHLSSEIRENLFSYYTKSDKKFDGKYDRFLISSEDVKHAIEYYNKKIENLDAPPKDIRNKYVRNTSKSKNNQAA